MSSLFGSPWTAAAALVLSLLAGTVPPCAAQEGSLLSTGITGTLTSSGLEDPLYVLGFQPVQAMVLDVARSSVTVGEARDRLRETPVGLDDLLRLGLLRVEGDLVRLDYLLLTAQDQRLIRQVAEELGPSLAEAFMEHRADYERYLGEHPAPGDPGELLFGLVAGMTLNWEGLRLTNELGYRAAPRERPNGDRFLVHSEQTGAELSWRGMYSGSHSFPGRRVSFTTFGDPPSIPRLKGVPDVFFGLGDDGLESLRDDPEVYGALRNHLLVLLTGALDDAGEVMMSVAGGKTTSAQVAAATGLPEARLGATLGVLEALGYLSSSGDEYRVAVPILGPEHAPLVEAVLELGRDVMTRWLEANHEHIRENLRNVSPLRNGLAFELVFSEVWHELFGVATQELAKRGFYQDPRAPGYRFEGYVPLVWASSLYGL